jgi:hypothetical protein
MTDNDIDIHALLRELGHGAECGYKPWRHAALTALVAERDGLRAELAAAQKQRDEARRLHCVEITRESMNPKRFTAEWAAKQLGWDCFKEGSGADGK